MFYSTTIKSVGYGGALDIYGNWLTFIGYLPVQVGDTVFTDGTVIFGNVPPRSSVTNIALEASGIPVLCANLRGYFNKYGVFKSYSIAGELWIVNSNEIFAHDLSYDDNEIIDTFISQSGQCLIATGGIYKKSSQLDTRYPLFVSYYQDNLSVRDYFTDYYFLSRIYEPCPLILGSTKFGNLNIPLRIFNDALLAQSFGLKTYGDMIESYALQCADEILAQSHQNSPSDGSLSFKYIFERQMSFDVSLNEYLGEQNPELLKGNVKDSWGNYMPENSYTRPNTFIAHTCAHILTFNLTENGFSATVFATCYGYCFPYLKPRFMKGYPPSKYDPDSMWTIDLTKLCSRNLAYVQEWKCVPFGASAIFRVSNGSPPEIVSFRKFGGINSEIFVPEKPCKIADADNEHYSAIHHDDYTSLSFNEAISTETLLFLASNNEALSEVSFLPVGDGFFSFNKFGLISFFNSERKLIASDIPIPDFTHIEAQTAFFDNKIKKSDARYLMCYIYTEYLIWDTDISNHICLPFNDKPDYMRCKIFYSTDSGATSSDNNFPLSTRIDSNSTPLEYHDGYTDRFIKRNEARDDGYYFTLDSPWRGSFSYPNLLPFFDAFYRVKGNTIENLHFTPLFYDFKNGSFLYGVKGGNLYYQKRSASGDISVTQVGSDCKNFRLHELDKIFKAKI